ncbi:hypothetical protein ACSX1A_18555 [Pontibacter sp. MBLB2868]|uniref:hypothetical protein n=1 Tax=Pontibacter sp. MBLB2868 TaxID=3451555 RepID=UPI003F74EDB2
MRHTVLIVLLTVVLGIASCTDRNQETIQQDSSEHTVASETGEQVSLPADVLLVTKPLVSGALYVSPSFESKSIASFDTSQQIQVLDTSHNIFVKARIRRDTVSMTGYVPKTILPENQ